MSKGPKKFYWVGPPRHCPGQTDDEYITEFSVRCIFFPPSLNPSPRASFRRWLRLVLLLLLGGLPATFVSAATEPASIVF